MLHASARAFESSIGGNPEFAVPPSCQQGCRFFLKHAGAAMLGPIVKIGKKQTIFEKGQAATHSYKVVEGAVRISRCATPRSTSARSAEGETRGRGPRRSDRSASSDCGDGTAVLASCSSAPQPV